LAQHYLELDLRMHFYLHLSSALGLTNDRQLTQLLSMEVQSSIRRTY